MLQSDSRKVKNGDTFIALHGVDSDGHNYIVDAIKRGAKRVICEHGKYDVDTLIVDNTNDYLDKYLKLNSIDIKIIGVTGTNGKTTTCYLIYQLLNKLGVKCAYIGTLGYIVDETIEELNNTTPGSLELYYLLKKSKDNNCKYVVMEISSQALDQNRVNFIELEYAIYTNLTRDHLDYHKTIDNYIDAKKKMFYLVKEDGISLLNNDDGYVNNFIITKYKTYGYKNSDYTINDDDEINGQKYINPLIGKFNKYNFLAAISVMYEMGYKYEELYEIVKNIKAPIGRMEVIEKDGKKVIIDYAHTPDAVEKVLKNVQKITTGRIITVLGCGGNRDKGKRNMMGKVSTDLSNYVIFTNDNPRYEEPKNIVNDIIYNLDNTNYEIVLNRENAIKRGIQLLHNNDILMVLGKGHEKYQIINGIKYPFDDKQIVIENL